jgi:hypothetical protein
VKENRKEGGFIRVDIGEYVEFGKAHKFGW